MDPYLGKSRRRKSGFPQTRKCHSRLRGGLAGRRGRGEAQGCRARHLKPAARAEPWLGSAMLEGMLACRSWTDRQMDGRWSYGESMRSTEGIFVPLSKTRKY